MRPTTTTLLALLIPWALSCATGAFSADPPPPTPDGGDGDSGANQDASTTDADSDGDTDTDSHGDTDADPDAGTDTETDSESDAGTDTGTDGDSDADTDADGDTDTAWCSSTGVWLDEGWAADLYPDGGDGVLETSWPGTRCWQDPPATEWMDWAAAVAYCEALTLGGYDDWALPTIDNLRALGRPTTADCAICGLADPLHLHESDAADCEACMPLLGGEGAGGCYWPAELAASACNFYWSSSEEWEDPEDFAWAWGFNGNYPGTEAFGKGSVTSVRCVRTL